MACLCSSFVAFYMHTFNCKTPIEGFHRDHIYVSNLLSAPVVKSHIRLLENNENIISINQIETNVSYTVTVRVGKLRELSRKG